MRLAKIIATSGIASRRQAEQLILDGRVRVNGCIIKDVVTFVNNTDKILVDGHDISKWLQNDFVMDQIQLWLFNKPKGVITSRVDPQGRPTLFSLLPQNMQKLLSVGRLDYNTEGLILLTNSGQLARYFELPKNDIARVYRCRVFGPKISEKILNEIRGGITIDGVSYREIKITHDSDKWLTMVLTEGKNREIRRILAHYGIKVTRLIRIQYGEFELGGLKSGKLAKVRQEVVERHKAQLFNV